jgi:putative intracellular protease/amidase
MGSDTSPAIADYAIIKEFGVMKTTLEGAGYTVVLATLDGQPVHGKALSITPDLKFSDVKVADYKALLLPCLDAGDTPPESLQIAKEALAQGKPIAAQNGGVFILSMAGILKGKNFAIAEYYAVGDGKQYFNPNGGKYVGDGVVQDGTILTSGVCPVMSIFIKKPDGTLELTQKLIAMMR